MDSDRIIEEGRLFFEELAKERQRVERCRFGCPVDLRSRVVVYAVACSADGESHGRIASRLVLGQPTLSRWMRQSRQRAAGVRRVAIVPATRHRATPLAARPPLRLVSSHGLAVEGLDPELLVSLLRILG